MMLGSSYCAIKQTKYDGTTGTGSGTTQAEKSIWYRSGTQVYSVEEYHMGYDTLVSTT